MGSKTSAKINSTLKDAKLRKSLVGNLGKGGKLEAFSTSLPARKL